MQQEKWESLRSGKSNPEAKFDCPKCGKSVLVHPNYVAVGIYPCLPRCNKMEDVARKMIECRGWIFLKLDKEKINVSKGQIFKNTIHFKKSDEHECEIKYETLRKGGDCKKCKSIEPKILKSKIENIKKSCLCKSKSCDHYNHLICCPDSSKEWAYDLNQGKSPKDYSPSSHKKAWWRCLNEWCKMIYEQELKTRAEGSRCPYCAGKKVCHWNCLETTHPEIAKDWDYENNNEEDNPKTISRGSHKKVWWICKNHPSYFKYQKEIHNRTSLNQGCPKCEDPGHDQKAGGHDYFVQEARKIHGDKYQYPEEYKGVDVKIQMYCPSMNWKEEIHGFFYQTPANHKNGNGCPKCHPGYEQRIGCHDYFVQEARKVHGDKYQYLEEYKGVDIKIQIYCPVLNKNNESHGIFMQTPYSHKAGSGCPKCHPRYNQMIGKHSYFVEKAREVHKDKYQYVEEYKGNNIKIQINCSVIDEKGQIHGIFMQSPSHHKAGHGCPKCNDPKYNQIHGGHDYFVQEARKVHGDKYQYVEEYKKNDIKIKIQCSILNKKREIHGIFLQTPNKHKNGQGCPKCANEITISRLAKLIQDMIFSIGYKKDIDWIEEYKHPLLRYIKPQKIDNMLLDINLAIEIDGSQHFHNSKYNTDRENLTIRIARDIYKDKFCLENNFSLIRIPYNHKSPEDYLRYAIDLCRKGVRIYFTYQHYYSEIIKMVNLDWTKIYVLIIPCPKIRN